MLHLPQILPALNLIQALLIQSLFQPHQALLPLQPLQNSQLPAQEPRGGLHDEPPGVVP